MNTKLLILFAVLCAALSLAKANPITPGFMEVTIEDYAIDRNALERPFGTGIFLLKDCTWGIAECLHLWRRETYDEQVDGAVADMFVPLDWQTFGFGVEFADLDHNSIITLSNEPNWTVGDLDADGTYLVTCEDPRFGSITLRVASQSNSVPEEIGGVFVVLCLGLLCFVKHRTYA